MTSMVLDSDCVHLTSQEELGLYEASCIEQDGGITTGEIQLDDTVNDVDFDDVENNIDLDMFISLHRTRIMLHSKPCTVCIYLCVITLLIGSVIALIIISVMVIAPYYRVSQFQDAYCSVANISWDEGLRQCSCGKSCSSVFPCLTIWITYMHTSTNIANTSTQFHLLHGDETMLDKEVCF